MKFIIKYPIVDLPSLKKLAKRLAKEEDLSLARAQEDLARRLHCSDWHQAVTSLEHSLELWDNGPREPESDPAWLTEKGRRHLQDSVLQPDESVAAMYQRVAKAASELLGMPGLYRRFLWALRAGHICPSSPILAGLGTDRLPIPPIFESAASAFALKELNERERETSCSLSMAEEKASGLESDSLNGLSVIQSSIGVAEVFNRTILRKFQGNVRRGGAIFHWPATHPEVKNLLDEQRGGSANHSFGKDVSTNNISLAFDDDFMKRIAGNTASPLEQSIWQETIKLRMATGYPLVTFKDTLNKPTNERIHRISDRFGLKYSQTGFCSEHSLPSGSDFSATYFTASLSAHRFDEWKDKGVVRLLVFFMDAVVDDYLQKAAKLKGHERAVNFARRSRALGLGVNGYHTLLQRRGLPFSSIGAAALNKELFSHIQKESEAASRELAALRGEPLWCQGEGYRHSHLIAIGPTSFTSSLQGVSDGISPLRSNLLLVNSSTGTSFIKNPNLRKLLKRIGKDTEEVWNLIRKSIGSVQSLDFLSDEEKKIYLTALEIDQRAIIQAAADRQPFVDQAQSLTLHWDQQKLARKTHKECGCEDDEQHTDAELNEAEVSRLHVEAWKAGLKSLYYFFVAPPWLG